MQDLYNPKRHLILAVAVAFAAMLCLAAIVSVLVLSRGGVNKAPTSTSPVDTASPSIPSSTSPDPLADQGGPRIYVSFASHNEDPHHPDYPDYVADKETFFEHRNNAIAYATMLREHGVRYDFQTDWNFLQGVLAYDKNGDASTNNKNVIRYLHEDLGVDIDPHSHQNDGYNFVDVAYLISTLGVEPTGVVGGFIAGPAQSSELEYFWSLKKGSKYPDATWMPRILWGGGTGQHQQEKDYWVSGVWKPKSAVDYKVHSESAPLPVVGRYLNTWEGLDDLLQKLHDGKLAADGFYTIAIMINQSEMDQANRDAYEKKIEEYQQEVEDGHMVYATISEAYSAWLSQGAHPSLLPYDGAETQGYIEPAGQGSKSGLGGGGRIRSTTECGDGICTKFEQTSGICAEDCR